MSKTDENLQNALTGEARARLKYTAFAMQPESTDSEYDKIEEMYRCFIRQVVDCRENAVASFRLAVETREAPPGDVPESIQSVWRMGEETRQRPQ